MAKNGIRITTTSKMQQPFKQRPRRYHEIKIVVIFFKGQPQTTQPS